MKTYQVLYTRKYNENYTSALKAEKLYDAETDAELLDKTDTYCRASDDDGLMVGNVYAVMNVNLPDWLPFEEWLGNTIEWAYMWERLGTKAANTLPADVQRELLGMSGLKQMVLGKLLMTKKFRSPFRASMAEQVYAWMETPKSERKFSSPLSPRQFEALCGPYDGLEAGKIDTRLYYHHRYNENRGLAA